MNQKVLMQVYATASNDCGAKICFEERVLSVGNVASLNWRAMQAK
jgi:hypothetical protein